MTIRTISSRELNQAVRQAKRAADEGPVFVTERGRLAHVLMSIEQHRRLSQRRRNISVALAMPSFGVNDFTAEPVSIGLRPAELW